MTILFLVQLKRVCGRDYNYGWILIKCTFLKGSANTASRFLSRRHLIKIVILDDLKKTLFVAFHENIYQIISVLNCKLKWEDKVGFLQKIMLLFAKDKIVNILIWFSYLALDAENLNTHGGEDISDSYRVIPQSMRLLHHEM